MRAEMASEKNGRFIPLDVSKVSTYILCLSTCCYNRLLVYLFPLLRIYYYLAVLLFFFLLVTYSSFPGFPPVQSRILHHVAVPNVYSILSYIERAGCMFLY